MPMPTEIRMLDSGYNRETRSLLYNAYRHEPTFAYLFEADRPGYDQRVRATVRELVNQHFLQDQPALGLMQGDRLIGAALIAPPQRRLDITESWAWRMRMLLTAGFRCTRRYLDYHQAILGCLPPGAFHVLPLMAVPSSRASSMASGCSRRCMTGAPKTRPPKAWSSTPAMRAIATSTNAWDTKRSARWPSGRWLNMCSSIRRRVASNGPRD